MRLIGAICLLFFPMASFAVPATVGYVLDGDTFSGKVDLSDGVQISVRVRLRNVDTPELHGECAEEILMANRAKTRLAELLPVGSVVDLRNVKDDKYLGRIDANVITPDGRDVGDVLVREKLGRKYNGGHRAAWCK